MPAQHEFVDVHKIAYMPESKIRKEALVNDSFHKYKVLWHILIRFSSSDTLAEMLTPPGGSTSVLP